MTKLIHKRLNSLKKYSQGTYRVIVVLLYCQVEKHDYRIFYILAKIIIVKHVFCVILLQFVSEIKVV